MKYDICVFGGCSMDMMFYGKEDGTFGEQPDKSVPGGKAANQAVAAARAGAKVAIITRLGKDKIGTTIVVPGVNVNTSGMSFLEIINAMSGGGLKQFSIFALGVMPYISASIVIQLLQMDIIPYFSDLAKEGYAGRRKLNRITRYLGIGVALIQGFGLAFLGCVLDIPYNDFCTRFDFGHSGMTGIEFSATKGELCVPKILQLSNDSHLYKEGLATKYQNRIYI